MRCFMALVAGQACAHGDSNRFMGVGSCSSSNCHGSSVPRAGSNIAQNEYIIWLKHDRHSKAFDALLSADGKIIAHHLGIESAEKSNDCLVCHSTKLPSANSAGEKFRAEDGVSCESCHGSSEKWLQPHAESGATHERNISSGLTDLNSISAQASTCAHCHLGTGDGQITHRLYGAGHPRLRFELDTYLALMPRHWVVDQDYISRKGAYSSGSGWLQGQLGLALEQAKLLLHIKSSDSDWPDFSRFYCYSCHHSLSAKEFRNHEYGSSPGIPSPNISSLLFASVALAELAPNESKAFRKAVEEISQSPNMDEQTVQLAINQIQKELIPAAQKLSITIEQRKAVLRSLISATNSWSILHYEQAEQLAMAAGALLNGVPGNYAAPIKRLYSTVEKPAEFIPEKFKRAVSELADKMRL
jgi:hypothetical protein